MNFSPKALISSLLSRVRSNNTLYNFGYEVLNASTHFNRYTEDKQKLSAILSNPAALKVFALQCDLFSMCRVMVLDGNDEEIKDDPFINLLKRPNPFQTQSQFLWDFMFWNMIGTSYTYVDSKIPDKIGGNKMYFLDPSRMEWPKSMELNRDKLILTNDTEKLKKQQVIKYRYNDASYTSVSLDKLIINTDLTNGLGNWYKGPSRIDALYKVISNTEFAMDAKNINLRYSGKFLVGAVNDISKIGLGEEEKKDLENKIDSNDKKVWAYKVPVDIKRFVSDMAALQLDTAYQADYFIIGSMYGIPRDVLETYLTSSTYENQEKARAAHVNYCLDPKGEAFMDAFENYFGYDAQGKKIDISWDHLSFMQVFEKERVDVKTSQINAFKSMLDMGIPLDEANQFLGTEFTIEKPQPNENQQGQTQEDTQNEEGQGEDETNQ